MAAFSRLDLGPNLRTRLGPEYFTNLLDGYSEVRPVRGAVKRVRRGEDRLRSGMISSFSHFAAPVGRLWRAGCRIADAPLLFGTDGDARLGSGRRFGAPGLTLRNPSPGVGTDRSRRTPRDREGSFHRRCRTLAWVVGSRTPRAHWDTVARPHEHGGYGDSAPRIWSRIEPGAGADAALCRSLPLLARQLT